MSEPLSALVVEDEPDLRGLIATVLERADVSTSTASCAADAYAALAGGLPRVLVLDLGLPDADGLDVLAAVRTAHASLPVLVLTARAFRSDRDDALRVGADEVLVKPFENAALVDVVQRLIARSDSRSTAP